LLRKGDVTGAEDILEKSAAALNDSTILEHLGDVKAKLGKNSDAWEAYIRAFEKNPGNKKLAKKIILLEKLVLPATIQRKLLKMAIANVLQIATLKTNFIISGQASDRNYRFVGILQYARPDRWRADILGSFMAPQIIIMSNGYQTDIFPHALQSSLLASGKNILQQVSGYFNAALIKKFDKQETLSRKKGGRIIYTLNDERLIIDRDSGMVCEYYGQSGMFIRFKRFQWEEGLRLPHRIELCLPQEKISSEIEITNYHLNQNLPDDIFSTGNMQ
jgi:outer membrane lipoprotein-sorting protein